MRIAVLRRALIAQLIAQLWLASIPGLAADGVAIVMGVEISRSELVAAGDEAAQIARLRHLVWEMVVRRYVAEQHLEPTSQEIAELLAYHREFDRRDRAQRARKLDDLNQRLEKRELDIDERARLLEFRAILIRMAARDAEADRLPPPDPEREGAHRTAWVETWKINKALYERYRGTVALSQTGPVAHGARAGLIAEYERRGLVRFLDSHLRAQLFAALAQQPTAVVPPERVDFTPYWKQPIPPSYFPD